MHLAPASLLGAVVVASDSTGTLINILIVALIFSLAFWVIGKMGVPEPINMILRVIVGIVALGGIGVLGHDRQTRAGAAHWNAATNCIIEGSLHRSSHPEVDVPCLISAGNK